MKVDSNYFDFLGVAEGYKSKVYADSGGLPTIGFGHLLTKSEINSGKIYINNVAVKYSLGLTPQQAMDLRRQDTSYVESCVNGLVQVALTQNQYNALISFTFNVGNEAFRTSTLLKKLNAGLYEEIPAQMRRWHHVAGKDVQGLINRREADVKLWLS